MSRRGVRLGGHNSGRPVNPWMSGNENRLTTALVDPQTQLAIASNLLNNLLSPAQQSGPPSLLSLGIGGGPIGNASGGMGNSRYGGSKYGMQRNMFDQPMRNLGRDFGRHDKGRRFGGDQGQKIQNRNRNNEQLKNKKEQENKSAADNKENQEKDKEEPMETTGDGDVKQEDGVEGKETTGEVKAEKTDSVAGSEAGPDTVDDYAGIAPCLFYCHICKKHMWDEESFVKHLDGRPHKMMIDELDQSYKLTVDLLRHDTRVMEQQRENDIQRAHRKGKTGLKMQQRGFCTMCDLNFLGTLPAHRRNERHQRLKKFLHPKCLTCDKEFYTRLEWDDHKLSAAHLKKLHDLRLAKRPELGVTEFDVVDFIEDVNDGIVTYDVTIKVDGERDTLTAEEREKYEENKESYVEEFQNLGKDEQRNSKFSPGAITGEEFTEKVTGTLCRACYRFMLTEDDKKAHCHTQEHFNNVSYLKRVKEKLISKGEQESKEEDGEGEGEGEGGKEQKNEEDQSQSANEETREADDDEPVAKRIKIEKTEDSVVVNGSAVEAEIADLDNKCEIDQDSSTYNTADEQSLIEDKVVDAAEDDSVSSENTILAGEDSALASDGAAGGENANSDKSTPTKAQPRRSTTRSRRGRKY